MTSSPDGGASKAGTGVKRQAHVSERMRRYTFSLSSHGLDGHLAARKTHPVQTMTSRNTPFTDLMHISMMKRFLSLSHCGYRCAREGIDVGEDVNHLPHYDNLQSSLRGLTERAFLGEEWNMCIR